MAGDTDSPGKIEKKDLDTMEIFFNAVITEIQKHRSKDKANQLKLWHEAFTETIRHLLSLINENDGNFTSNQIINLFLNRLIDWWEFVDDEPLLEDIPKKPPATKHKHIINWYFLKEDLGESVLGIGGYGSMAEHYSIRHSQKVRPFRDAIDNANKYGNYLIQDFPKWLGRQNKQKSREYIQNQIKQTPDYEKYLHNIKAWAGFPIKAGRNSYLMVVHADTENYFTTRRTKLLRTVALRLAPFLLWGDSVNLQTILLKMLNHELNTPLSVAKQTLNEIPESEIKTRAIDNFEFLEAVIKNMSHLYQEPNSNTMMTTRLTEILDVHRIANTLAKRKRAIFTKYDNDYNKIELAVSKDTLRQVMFNLFSNAFKFADDNTKNPCITIDISREYNQLVCRISNPTIKEMSKEQLKWIFALGYKIIGAGPASGYGLGLAIVDILCNKANMKCDAETPVLIEEGIWQQTFTLKIPIAGD
ncbi:sensor histidine kinase [Thiothrix fructosivorans]|uniref:HAMP domain-containing histidine kinase n=1 Tax=Thiothrix fructosivorans TaxID=111770 RepID=A0A8B0SFH8_9GAMM|nr:HAMP domain-containing sensor histidine kinase [Thiothrix fructosivorans]MBO0615013.1 HAMP domain-containing histidine kinase [Thiothrix fructosivorans]QTX09814.1 HAMP domain-containing histidine kinase [Thiothrix fructosivorans]